MSTGFLPKDIAKVENVFQQTTLINGALHRIIISYFMTPASHRSFKRKTSQKNSLLRGRIVCNVKPKLRAHRDIQEQNQSHCSNQLSSRPTESS